jgi:hypothetical protein
LDLGLGHRLRQQPVGRRTEERLGGAEQRLDHDQLPDPRAVSEDQHGEQRMQREAHEIGDDHHAVARQAIGPHAAEQQKRHQRKARGREHQSEIGGAAREIDHEQRQRDDHNAVADHARGLREPQVAEVAVAQDAQLLGEVAHLPSLTQGLLSAPVSSE